MITFKRFIKEKDDNWVTIKGTHVQLDGNGNVIKGPDALKKKLNKSGSSSTSSSVTDTKTKKIPDEFRTPRVREYNFDYDKTFDIFKKMHKNIGEVAFDVSLKDPNDINEAIKRFYKDNPGTDRDICTPQRIAAITIYTSDAYMLLNNIDMIGVDDEKIADAFGENARKILDDALLSLPDYKGGAVKRTANLPEDVLQSYLDNDFVTTGDRFTSTTKNHDFDFASNSHTMIIKTKTAKDISSVSVHQEEQEVLIQRNTNFQITKRTKNEDGTYTFEMEEI